MYKVWTDVNELRDSFFAWSKMPEPIGLLMVTPRYFDVVDVKNPYMLENVGNVETALAELQWNHLQAAFMELTEAEVIHHVQTLEGEDDLEDMVFCANPIFEWILEDGRPVVLLSNMRHERRQGEVDAFKHYFAVQGIKTRQLPEEIKVEGNGDLIPHPGLRAVWMGYGFRTDLQAAEWVANTIEAHVIPLKLVSHDFYHLDTCFCVIDTENVAICTEAFDEESIRKIMAVFTHVHEVPLKEAKENFALNSLIMRAPSGQKYGILPLGNETLKEILINLDTTVIEVDTSEYIKSGGSVYCMKMFLYR